MPPPWDSGKDWYYNNMGSDIAMHRYCHIISSSLSFHSSSQRGQYTLIRSPPSIGTDPPPLLPRTTTSFPIPIPGSYTYMLIITPQLFILPPYWTLLQWTFCSSISAPLQYAWSTHTWLLYSVMIRFNTPASNFLQFCMIIPTIFLHYNILFPYMICLTIFAQIFLAPLCTSWST